MAMGRPGFGAVVWRGAATAALAAALIPAAAWARSQQAPLTSHAVPIIPVDGLRFRDLDRNGALTPYEDWRLPAETRAKDLIARMTLPEKAGQMVIANAFGNAPFGQLATDYAHDAIQGMANGGHVTHFLSMLVLPTAQLAAASNGLQDIAESGRLGIPVVLATDPRHHFQQTTGASVAAGDFSQWPEALGFGAVGDPQAVRAFADVVRRDYRATGFSLALGPQADLATEPRWPRINGTFGADAQNVSRLTAAYVAGAQGSQNGVARDGVATVVKHFAGYGAAKDGWDAHNRYGRFADLSQDDFALHVKPFSAAIAANVSGVMPAYSVLPPLSVAGSRVEPVGAAYSSTLIKGLLRKKLRFRGVVLSDWAITNDCGTICREGFPPGRRPSFEGISMAWGVEDLSVSERFAKAVNAGVDQFGGVSDPSPIVEAVQHGLIDPARVDSAVTRILTRTFQLGLFESPFVDAQAAARIAGTEADKAAGLAMQARAMVVLEDRGLLPLKRGTRVYLQNVDAGVARAAGFTVVARPEEADLAIIRTAAPFEKPHPQYFFGSVQHEGGLAFPEHDPALETFRKLEGKLPVIVDVYLDRPAILTPFKSSAGALLANFGASDAAFFDAITGAIRPEGRLPFELPASMEAVAAQGPGTPADTANPLYPMGYRDDRSGDVATVKR